MNKYISTVNHFKILMENHTKDVHHLKATDLNGYDKMNFGAVLAICNEHIQELLAEVPGSSGTVMYVKIMRYVISSFTDETITTSDRVYRMWYAVFVLRLWREWIYSNINYSADNFITYNAYMCVELNAHALLNCIEKFRNTPHLLVW